MKSNSKLKIYTALHILLFIMSAGSICSKMASNEAFLSIRFILFYGGLIVILGIYAVGWQQIIKRIPLTTAYANKAITVFWGMIWGSLLFNETLSIKKVLGAVIVIVGVVLFAIAEKSDQDE